MSDTPRTDAAAFWHRPQPSECDEFHGRVPDEVEYVDADFARDLERELNEFKGTTPDASR